MALATVGVSSPRQAPSLAGEWDVYIALSAKPKFGFEGWRRMGFAHFAGSDSGSVGWLKRRTGEPMLTVTQVSTTGDSVLLTQDARMTMHAAWHGDTLTGVQVAGDRVLDRRFRLVRRATPGVVEHDYQVWTMPASDSQYAVTEDTLVFMPTRDGARLATYIARPVGKGPFGVVLQRTPYRRVLHPAGRWWASRGYIFVAQHVRGRDQSSGDVADFGDYDKDIQDGYDAVEWAAKLPGANGKVGMIGHSDEGKLVWLAAVSEPAAPRGDLAHGRFPRWVDGGPLRRDGVRAHQRGLGLSDAHADHGSEHRGAGHRGGHHPPAAGESPAAAGVRRRAAVGPLDRTSDARRVLAQARGRHLYRRRVRAPVLSMAGWHDDSRGPTYYTGRAAAAVSRTIPSGTS